MEEKKCAGFVARQGDVLILSVNELPSNIESVVRETNAVVLAHGEATGHAHAIRNERAALFRDPKLMAVFLQVSGDDTVALEHEEHDTVHLPPGNYRVIRQREYSPEAIRNVAD